MAGWDDSLFGNLPTRRRQQPQLDLNAPPQPTFPANPADPNYSMPARIGSAIGIEAQRAGNWLYNAATVPGDVARGKASMSDPATQSRVMDLSSLVSGGPLAGGTPEDALSMGVSRAPKSAEEIATGKAAADAAKAANAPKVAWNPTTQQWEGGPVQGLTLAGPPGAPDLYNFNDPALRQTPNVPQFDLPRFNPPKGVSQRVQDLIANPDVRSQMLDGMRRGMDVGAPWYNAQPAIQPAIDALGSEQAGRSAFARLQDFMGATSNVNPVPQNMRTASYYYWREKNGLPPPAIGDPTPEPYGAMAQKTHQANVQKLSEGGEGYDPVNNPKPPSFAQGLQGNYAPVAIDRHAFKAPAMLSQDPRFLTSSAQKDLKAGNLTMADAVQDPSLWADMPNANEYPALEQYYKSLADELGVAPAQAQAAGWVGHGDLTGLKTEDTATWLQLWQNRINNTAMRTGMSPQEAESGFWQGKHPLLTGGGSPSPLMQQFSQSPAGQQTYPTYDPNQWLQPGEQGA